MNVYETLGVVAGNSRSTRNEPTSTPVSAAGRGATSPAATVECTCPEYCDLDHGND